MISELIEEKNRRRRYKWLEKTYQMIKEKDLRSVSY